VNAPPLFSIERIAPGAASYLRRLPPQQQRAVAEAFDYLCQISPFHHSSPTTIKPLKGKYQGQWRYRIGKLRIVYSVNKDSRTIRITAIDNRGDVY
jgi:mRNA interferase RelE/StbE